jgi:signal peptidase I
VRILDRSLSRLPRPLRTLVDWALTLTLAVVGVLVFQAEIAKPYRIPTSSMESTLHCAAPADGCRSGVADRVIANRLVYRFHAPERGDIVVFTTPAAARSACGAGGTFVKRIVGLPGETVSMRDGVVLIDGAPLREPYLAGRGSESGEWLAGEGYFVLGDNRARSCDSRRWGSVPRGDVIGRVDVRYWPPSRIGPTG